MAKDDRVIVVGAGTVGLTTALGLARAGFVVRVLEKGAASPFALRDDVYHWSVLPGMARLGVLDSAIHRGFKNARWTYKVLDTGERITFDLGLLANETEFPFNLHLSRKDMVDVLLAELAGHADVQIEWNANVTALTQDNAGVVATVDVDGGAREYRADWLIGADGSHSTVRRAIGLGLPGTTLTERFVATDLDFDFSTLDFELAGFLLDDRFGAVVVSLGREGLWRYTFAENRTLPEDGMPLRLQSILSVALPDGAEPKVERARPYRLHQRAADTFRIGRVMLAGDAAHLTNPISGYGMASGLCDSFALVDALTTVVHSAASEDVLDRYSQVRRRNFWAFTSPESAEIFEFVFHPTRSLLNGAGVARYREIVANPAKHREYLRATAGCWTPSIIDESEAIPLL